MRNRILFILLFAFVIIISCLLIIKNGKKDTENKNAWFGDAYVNEIKKESSSERLYQGSLEHSNEEAALEIYQEVLRQYREMVCAGISDVGQDSVQEKLIEGGEWEYVWDELYAAGQPDEICYSLRDLTGDGFPEMIMGIQLGGYVANNQFIEPYFDPYVIYFYSEKKGIKIGCAKTIWYKMTLYDGGIVELGGAGGINPKIYLQFQEHLESWVTLVEVGVEYDYVNNKKIGYYREDSEGMSELNHENISEEEYLSIIQQYTIMPIQLEWTVLGINNVKTILRP